MGTTISNGGNGQALDNVKVMEKIEPIPQNLEEMLKYIEKCKKDINEAMYVNLFGIKWRLPKSATEIHYLQNSLCGKRVR